MAEQGNTGIQKFLCVTQFPKSDGFHQTINGKFIYHKVCFTVCGNERIQEESWAPFLQSAVVFGRCHLVENQEDIIKLVKKFAMKYYPDEKMVDEEVASSGRAVQMFEIEIEHLSGKEVQER